MGWVELEGALTEVVDAVIAHAAVAIAGEYVEVPRAVDGRRTTGLPHTAATVADGLGRENAGLRQRALVVSHDPAAVEVRDPLILESAESEHDVVARENQRYPLPLEAGVERHRLVDARDHHAGAGPWRTGGDVHRVQSVHQRAVFQRTGYGVQRIGGEVDHRRAQNSQ